MPQHVCLDVVPIHDLPYEELQRVYLLWPEIYNGTGSTFPPMTDDQVARYLGTVPPIWLDKYEALQCLKQGERIGIGPPSSQHVILKPRQSKNGLGVGVVKASQISESRAIELLVNHQYMWQDEYIGPTLSVDVAMYEGEPQWMIWAEGIPNYTDPLPGRFLAWGVYPYLPPCIGVCWKTFNVHPEAWLLTILGNGAFPDYTGILNIEGVLHQFKQFYPIEVHFRPSLEFGPLYGPEARRHLLLAALGVYSGRPTVAGGSMVVVPKQAVMMSNLGVYSECRDNEGSLVAVPKQTVTKSDGVLKEDDDSWRESIYYTRMCM